jgi:mRNA-degrading endonuclease toxin of MazEF toxin-antitoxin module
MVDRGDVLRLKSRLGFLPRGETGAVVVVQAGALNQILPTVLCVPLDPALALYAANPRAVVVPSAESGGATDSVAVVTQLRPVALDHLAPGVVARLTPATLARLDHVMRLVLGL